MTVIDLNALHIQCGVEAKIDSVLADVRRRLAGHRLEAPRTAPTRGSGAVSHVNRPVYFGALPHVS